MSILNAEQALDSASEGTVIRQNKRPIVRLKQTLVPIIIKASVIQTVKSKVDEGCSEWFATHRPFS